MYNTEEKFELSKTNETVEQVLTYPIKGLPERGIDKDTCNHYKVRVSLSEEDGKTITAIYFPSYTKGKVTGFKKKDLTIPKGEKYHFTSIGTVKINSELFGQHCGAKGGKNMWITEGELDAMAVYSVLKEKYPGANPTVTSISLGTANAAEHIANNLPFIREFKNTVICFDNDEATPAERKKGVKRGKEAVQDVAKILSDIKVVSLSEKDANDMVLANKSDELYWDLVSKAKKFVPEEIKFGGDTSLDEILTPLKEGRYVSCLPKTMALLHGLRGAELTVVLAPTSVGKTTLVKEVGYSLITDDEYVGSIYLEEDLVKSKQSFIALDQNILLPAFREDPAILSREKAQESYDKIINNGRTIWLAHFGSLASENLMDKLRYMAASGATYIVLDHLSMVFSGQKNENEVKAIDELLTSLAAFVKATEVHVIVVAHVKRRNFNPPKDSDNNIEYPYWYPVAISDGRGSGAFEQLAFNVWTMEPEILDDKSTRGRIRIKVAKNREWGLTGLGDTLMMDRNTGRLVSAEDEVKHVKF